MFGNYSYMILWFSNSKCNDFEKNGTSEISFWGYFLGVLEVGVFLVFSWKFQPSCVSVAGEGVLKGQATIGDKIITYLFFVLGDCLR